MSFSNSKKNCLLICCAALVSIFTVAFVTIKHVRADGERVFELRVYHAVPGKMPALEARFRDTTSKLLAKHNLNVLGYWVSEKDNTFVWLVAHTSQDDAKKHYGELFADPAFQETVKAEQAEKLVEKIDSTFMRPCDF